MKLIDLINDLFDYREFQTDKLPKKIRFNNKEFVFVDNSYYNENGINIMAYVDNTLDLRVEIEITEEDKEIEERIEKLGEELNKHFQLMVEAKKYFFPEIHEDLLGKKDKEIEYKPIQELKNKRFTNNQKQIAGKINEIIKTLNELKKGK